MCDTKYAPPFYVQRRLPGGKWERMPGKHDDLWSAGLSLKSAQTLVGESRVVDKRGKVVTF